MKVSSICLAIYGGIDDFHCNLLNLSLGVTSDYMSLREAIAYAAEKNVTVVSATGNAGNAAYYYPAAYDSVIGVGSVDRDGHSRSNHNDSVFLTAPGADVRSVSAYGGYNLGSGASYAAPQVTGAAAVLLGIDPSLTPSDIRRILSQTASDRGAAGYDEYYGYGVLNVAGCTELLERETALDAGTPCSFLPLRGAAGRIRNNTDKEIHGAYLLADYEAAGKFQSVKLYYITIPAHDDAAIEIPDAASHFGQFVCEAETLLPLAKPRKNE